MKGQWTRMWLGLALVAGLLGVLPAPRALAACVNDATTQFRSVVSGNWDSTATWECSDDGSTWQAATVTPTSSHGVITIRSPHVVMIVANVTVDQVTVSNGGQLEVASSITWTLADGTGTDLSINGTLLNRGGTWTSTGTWTVGAGGTYIHNTTSGIATPLGKATLDTASDFIYRGSSSLTPAVSLAGKTYGSLSFESTSGAWTTSFSGANVLTIMGDFTLGSNVTFNSSNTTGLLMAGNWTNNGIFSAGTAGTVTFNKPGTATYGGSGTTTFNDLVVNSGTTLDVGTTALFGANGTVTNNGTLKQTKTVNANSTVDFLNVSTNKYYGVQIAAGGTGLGSTTVSVSGNQICSQAQGYPVKRCFDVTPATAASADIKFYYSQAEMQTGQTYGSLNVWNYHNSTWNAVTRGGDSGSCNTGAINCYVQGNGISTYSPFALKNSSPLAVLLAEFSAQQVADHVLVSWETNSELNNRGFNLYRGTSPAGPDRQLNDALIPSQSQGGPGGFLYTWEDAADLVPGTTYFYWLDDVDLNGVATRHGPVSVDFVVPTAVTLTALHAQGGAPWLPSTVVVLVVLAALAVVAGQRRLVARR